MQKQLTPKDIIAIIIVVFCFVLLAFKIDTIVGAVLIAVVAYYFGSQELKKVQLPE